MVGSAPLSISAATNWLWPPDTSRTRYGNGMPSVRRTVRAWPSRGLTAINGFAELVTGLWCRPDNLVQTLDLIRHQLIVLGLEPEAVVMQVGVFPGVESEQLYALWPREQLETGYREYIAALSASEKRIKEMSIPEAARETFLVGEAVIRRINADPFLPAQMVDARSRHTLITQMVQYERLGRSVWEAFLAGQAGREAG